MTSVGLPHPLSTIRLLPLELVEHAFEYLDIRHQVVVSKVCKEWWMLSQSTLLELGKLSSLLQMSRVKPLQQALYESSVNKICTVHSVSDQYIAFSDTLDSRVLLVFEKKTRKVMELDLNEALSFHEKEQAAGKTQTLWGAFVYPGGGIWTLSTSGIMAEWKKNLRGISCTQHWQVLTQELLDTNRRSVRVALTAKTLYVHGRLDKSFLAAFDLETSIKKFHVIDDKFDPLATMRVVNSTTLFCTESDPHFNYIRAYRFDAEGAFVCQRRELVVDGRSINHAFAQVGANDQWVIAACYDCDTLENLVLTRFKYAYYQVFNAANLDEDVCTIKVELRDADGNHAHIIPREPYTWLCANFFVIWIARELLIYHLETKSFHASINLEQFFAEGELNNSHIARCPVLNVGIYNDSIEILLQSSKEYLTPRQVQYQLGAETDKTVVDKNRQSGVTVTVLRPQPSSVKRIQKAFTNTVEYLRGLFG